MLGLWQLHCECSLSPSYVIRQPNNTDDVKHRLSPPSQQSVMARYQQHGTRIIISIIIRYPMVLLVHPEWTASDSQTTKTSAHQFMYSRHPRGYRVSDVRQTWPRSPAVVKIPTVSTWGNADVTFIVREYTMHLAVVRRFFFCQNAGVAVYSGTTW